VTCDPPGAGAFLLVVSGLLAEARIASGKGVIAIAGAGDARRLAKSVARGLGDGAGGVVSFGMAAGLNPHLRPGAIVIPETVVDGGERFATDAAWASQLRALLPQSSTAPVAGIDVPVADVSAKAHLHAVTGADAADMESHIAARGAARFGVPLAILRVIADPADRALPAAAVAGLGGDGRPAVRAILGALAGHPWQLPALVRVAADALRAMRVLSACGRLLGPRLGLPLRDPRACDRHVTGQITGLDPGRQDTA
jgi:adenosylhomocysteine nucleosidase